MLSRNLDNKSSRTPADLVHTEAVEQNHANSFSLPLGSHSLKMMVCICCRPPDPKCLPGDRTHLSQWPSRELCIKTADKFIIAKGQEAQSPEFLCCVERRAGCLPLEVSCHGSDLQVNIWELLCFQPCEQSG